MFREEVDAIMEEAPLEEKEPEHVPQELHAHDWRDDNMIIGLKVKDNFTP